MAASMQLKWTTIVVERANTGTHLLQDCKSHNLPMTRLQNILDGVNVQGGRKSRQYETLVQLEKYENGDRVHLTPA